MKYELSQEESKTIATKARYNIVEKCSKDLGESNDCTVRALAMCFNLSYSRAYSILKIAGRPDKKGIASWRIFQIEEGCSREINFFGKLFKVTRYARPKMNVNKFSQVKNKGIYYIIVPSHAYAQIDGVTFNELNPNQFIKYFFEIKPIKLKI